MEEDAELEAGQLVEVTGRPEFGDFRNILMLTGAQVIGKGTIPEPVQLDSSQALSLDTLYRWSEFEGDIYSAVQDENRFYLSIAGPEFGVYVMLPKRPDFLPLSELRTSRIRLGGVPVLSSQQTAPWRLDLHSPEGGMVKITPSVVKKDQPKLRDIFSRLETGDARRSRSTDTDSSGRTSCFRQKPVLHLRRIRSSYGDSDRAFRSCKTIPRRPRRSRGPRRSQSGENKP